MVHLQFLVFFLCGPIVSGKLLVYTILSTNNFSYAANYKIIFENKFEYYYTALFYY